MPQEPLYGLWFERRGDEPGHTLRAGSGPSGLTVLAEQVAAELARIDQDVDSASNPVPLQVHEVTVGTTASFTFTVPLLDLNSVRIVGQARGSDSSSNFAGLQVTLNGVAAGSYFSQRHRIIDTVIDTTIHTGQDSWNAGTVAGDNMPSTGVGAVDILITSLQANRTLMHSQTSAMTGSSGAAWRTETNKGFSTVETVSTIEVFMAGVNEFMIGSRLELWPA